MNEGQVVGLGIIWVTDQAAREANLFEPIEGEHVMPLACGCCLSIVGAQNTAEFERMQRTRQVYVCRACGGGRDVYD